jgi:hypothetical protein
MTTFSDVIDEVALSLSGYTMRQDRTTHLLKAINSSELTLEVNSVSNISKGIIEIDDELMWVDSFDKTSKYLFLPPYGRGYLGTTPTSHLINAKVTIAPTFPRHSIKKAINDTIRSTAGTLFGIQSTVFDYNPSVTTYALPYDSEDILSVSYEDIGPTKEWYPIRRYRVDRMADVESFNSNVSITVYDLIPTSSRIKVTYVVDPEPFNYLGDDYEGTTNLPLSTKDIIVLGACYRLLSFIDPGRLSFSSPEADAQSSRIQYGSGTNTAKYIYALYQQRLQEESSRLREKYPVRVHYTR